MKGPDYQRLIVQALRQKAFVYQGIRKILQAVDWEPARLPEVTFADLGYGNNKAKQLERNYWNDEEIERVYTVLHRRQKKAFTSVAVSLRNKPKDSRSMGHCMLSLVVSRTRDIQTVEVQYRSTELGLKFSGDLAWLPTLTKALGVEPDIYRFRFANCFLSGVYLPYIGAYWEDGAVDLLERAQVLDPRFFESATRFFWRSSMQEKQFFPYSPEAVAHKFNWAHNRAAMPDIKRFLASAHAKFGKGKPEIHPMDGSYVPRGKRKEEDDDE